MTAGQAELPNQALSTSRSAIAATICIAAAAALLYEALATSDRPNNAVVWGGLSLAAYAFGLLCLVTVVQGSSMGLARWKFGACMLLWWAIAFGVATVSWSQPQTGIAAEISVASVLRALWLLGVAMTAWCIGYFVGPGQPLRDLAARAIRGLSGRFTAQVRTPATPWLLYAIGIAARVANTATTNRFGYVGEVSSAVSTATGYGQILSMLSLCAPLAVAAAAMQAYRERSRGARITVLVLYLSELAFGAAAGGKESFVVAVLAVAIPFSGARHRLPKGALVALILLFLVIVIPFNQAYRNVARQSSATLTAGQALSAAPEILGQTVRAHGVLTVLPNSIGYLIQRIREIDSVAIVIQRTPSQIGFLNTAQLIEAPLAGVVPRAIWSGKPILATGYQFGQQYYELPSNLYTSSAITPMADLYRHGGWIPLIGGMLLLGCGVRLLDDILDVRENPHVIFLALLLFPSLVGGEDDWITLLAQIPDMLVIWLAALAFTFRRRRPV